MPESVLPQPDEQNIADNRESVIMDTLKEMGAEVWEQAKKDRDMMDQLIESVRLIALGTTRMSLGEIFGDDERVRSGKGIVARAFNATRAEGNIAASRAADGLKAALPGLLMTLAARVVL